MSLLLKNARYIITQNSRREVLENKDVLIEGSAISEIGEHLSGDEVVDCSHNIVMPGLINLHTHSAMNLLKGYSDDLKLDDWLGKKIWPIEAKFTKQDFHYGSMLAFLEMVKTGTTCFNDMYFSMDLIAKSARQIGIRGFLGYGMIDLNSEEKREKEIKETLKLRDFIKNMNDSKLKFAVAPHAPYTCSEELLLKAKEIADAEHAPYHIHVSETKKEVSDSVEKFGKRPVMRLHDLGVLGNSVIAAHAVWVNDTEWKMLKGTKTKVVNCPVSNLKLSSGVPPWHGLKELKAGLGTDSAASNNNLSMFEDMKSAALIQKLSVGDASLVTAQDVLDMATVNGADALNINAGKIEAGMLADIITLNVNQLMLNPLRRDNLISNIVYSASGADVHDTIIDGKVIMRYREVLTADQDEILNKSNERSRVLFSSSE